MKNLTKKFTVLSGNRNPPFVVVVRAMSFNTAILFIPPHHNIELLEPVSFFSQLIFLDYDGSIWTTQAAGILYYIELLEPVSFFPSWFRWNDLSGLVYECGGPKWWFDFDYDGSIWTTPAVVILYNIDLPQPVSFFSQLFSMEWFVGFGVWMWGAKILEGGRWKVEGGMICRVWCSTFNQTTSTLRSSRSFANVNRRHFVRYLAVWYFWPMCLGRSYPPRTVLMSFVAEWTDIFDVCCINFWCCNVKMLWHGLCFR